MKLNLVTITGADDNTDVKEMIELSEEYPFVEWGILFSEKKIGSDRYPSADWLNKLYEANLKTTLERSSGGQFSAHLCGQTMRHFLQFVHDYGINHNPVIPAWIAPWKFGLRKFDMIFDRAQLNFNWKHEAFSEDYLKQIYDNMLQVMNIPCITQLNHNNNGIWELFGNNHSNTHALHDASGGTGKVVGNIPPPIAGVYTGYAGGLNPNNVVENLNQIHQVIPKGYTWIDMESGVRTNNKLDMNLVASVLAKTKQWVDETNGRTTKSI